jgi:ATP-dependent RNA helicase SUPV3L1/SUV3
MGALSPRTRNAQVALYQSREVDYIVATDAIGMGLNLDVDRVVFASRTKYDGRRHRALTLAECAQIAGRAGRFRTDGEFGETGSCPPFQDEEWKAIEGHRFDPVDAVQWRNSALDYSSLKALIRSLERPSGKPVLIHNPRALDEWVLRRMSEDGAIGPNVTGDRKVRRLWDLARLPDFRKAGPEGHGRLVLGLAETLADPDARLSDEGLRRRMDDLSSVRGDINQLQQRLAAIRTWTYAANREDWLENPTYWQQKTREIEDSLSDALHLALTARFVDRRTTALLASLRKEDALVTDLTPEGDVTVEGHLVGRLRGLSFEPVVDARTLEGKAVRGAALAAIRPMLTARLAGLKADDPDQTDVAEELAALDTDDGLAAARRGAAQRHSALGWMGRLVEPLVKPLGWDWRLGCAAIASFPAREVVLGTLAVIYNLGDIDPGEEEGGTALVRRLRAATWDGTNRKVFTLPVALSIMVFFALCAQCASTLVVIGRETSSWLWPVVTFTYMTVLAWLGAFATYQIGTWLGG